MQTIRAKGLCAAFSLALLIFLASAADAANWIDSADVSWYDEGKAKFDLTTGEQLAGLAKLVNDGNTFQDKTVRLDADLSLVERDWTPIGVWVDSAGRMMFRGTFDGQGHLIRIKFPLFGNIGAVGGGNNVGTVLNVNLSGDVSYVSNRKGHEMIGVLAREACGTIKNCSFTGFVNIEKTGGRVTLGGLIGSYAPSNKGMGELSDCRVRARMAVRGKNCHTEMGGIVATCGGTVRNCVFEGELSVDIPLLDPNKPRSFALGGIVKGGTVSIKDCRSRFSVSLGENRFDTLTMGGIKGGSYDGSLENCLAEWTVSEDCWVNDESSIGGIAGRAYKVTNCVFDGSLAVGSSPQIALGGIVCNKSERIAGDGFTADIQAYMRRQHNIKIGERTAEDIKIAVGAALADLENPPTDFIAHGPDLMSALPIEVPVSYQEIAHCLEKSLSKIETAIISVLEQTPPELYADIVKSGIYLAGGGALLRGLDKRLSDKIKIPFIVAEDPLHAVARGTGIALKNVENCAFLMR